MSIRIEKLNELIKQQLSKYIQKEMGELYGIICVNDVKTNDDLEFAKVYVSILCKKKNKNIIKILQSKSYFFQNQLGKNLFIKNIPKLKFILDESLEKINRVEQLISKIESEHK